MMYLVDFKSGVEQLDSETIKNFDGRLDEVPGIFGLMKPLSGSIEAFQLLSKIYDTLSDHVANLRM